MKRTRYKIDKRFEKQALEEIAHISGADLQGVSDLGAGDIRIWYKVGDEKYGVIVVPIKNDLVEKIEEKTQNKSIKGVKNVGNIAVKRG